MMNNNLMGNTPKHMGLVVQLAVRDLNAQYAQSLIGIVWALIQPLTGLVIYTFLFDRVLNATESNSVPYPVFVFPGVLHWFLFSSVVVRAGTSLLTNISIIKNWRVPKLVFPLSKSFVSLFEFGLSLPILFFLLWYFDTALRWQMLLCPLFILMNLFCSLSIVFWLSSLTVRYRDFHHIIPFLIGFGIFVTPVFFSSTLIPAEFGFLIYFNPMSLVIEGFRWSLLGGEFEFFKYAPAILITVIGFVTGLLFFRKQESTMVDYL